METPRVTEIPQELILDAPSAEERNKRISRWVLLNACSLPFTEPKKMQIARNEMEGYQFHGAVSKTWNGLYGNQGGLSWADIEIEAEALGVYDDVFGYREAA